MVERFSIRRVLGAIGRILKHHWAGLLAVLAVLGLGRVGLEQLFDLVARGFHADKLIWPTATSFVRVALTALLAGAFLQRVLVGARSWKASTRAALTSFPVVYGVLLLIALPHIVGAGLATVAAADAVMQDLVWTKLKFGLAANLISLVLYALISPAAAIAVAETASPATALTSALRLTRKRRLRIVLIELASIVLAAVAFAGSMSLPLLTLDAPLAMRVIPLIQPVMDVLSIGLEMMVMAAIYQELRRTRPAETTA